jgi:hypothetical protein
LFILFERVSCIAKEDEMQRKRQRRIQSIASIVLAGVAVAIVLVSLGADLIGGLGRNRKTPHIAVALT